MKLPTIIISILTVLLIHFAIAQKPTGADKDSATTEEIRERLEPNRPLATRKEEGEPVADVRIVERPETDSGEVGQTAEAVGVESDPAETGAMNEPMEDSDESLEGLGEAVEGSGTPEEEGEAAPVAGEEEKDEEIDTEVEEGTVTGVTAEPEQPVIQESGAKVSIDFPDEEIRTILRIVADLYDLNLVIPELLTGRASIKLRNVTWQQVFDVVLSPVGFTYVSEDNIIKIISLESLQQEPPVTEVVILNYALATDIEATIRPMVDAQTGRIQVDKRSNALVITESPTRMRRVRAVIEKLDQPTMQVMIESKFIETRNRAVENIGVNWTSLDGYNASAGPFTHSYQKEKTSGQNSNRDQTSGSTSASSSQISQGVTGGVPFNDSLTESKSSATGGVNSFAGNTNLSSTARLSSAVFSADEFNVVLSALRTTNDVKLVSNPTVVTLNNKEANIHIGQEYPVVTPRYNPETGTYEAGGKPEITQIGISLNVTPQINSAGFINLDVEPEVSTLGDTVTYFGAEYPIKVTRRAHTFVTIKDGYTVAIGGLVQDDTINTETRVPILGSIPVLGRLFRSNSNDKDQQNLIIFITARTLNPDGSSYEEILDPRVVRNMGLTREEIPGYRSDVEMFPGEKKALEELQAEPEELEETELETEELQSEEEATEKEAQAEELSVEKEDVMDPVSDSAEIPADVDAPLQEDAASAESPEIEPEPEPETEPEDVMVDEVEEESPVSGEEPDFPKAEEETPVSESNVSAPPVEEFPVVEPVTPEPSAPVRRSRWLTPVQ